MREMRKIKRKLSEEDSYSLLKDLKTITVSMYDEEEKVPYAVVLNPIVDGHTIFVHCANEGRKIDILRKNNSVCITAVSAYKIIEEQFTTAYKSVVINSHARFIENRDEKVRVLNVLCKKFAPSKDENSVNRIISAELENTTIIAFDVELISGKNHLNAKLKK